METLADHAAEFPNGTRIMMTDTFRLLSQSIKQEYYAGRLSKESAKAAEEELLGTYVVSLKLIKEMAHEHWENRIGGLLLTLDSLRKKFDLQNPEMAKEVACHKGCSACCYIQVGITRDEAKLLAKTIVVDQLPIDMDKLRAQAEREKQDPDVFKDSGVPCIFLSDDKTCSVYETRPGACRNYRVMFDSKACGDPSHTKVPVLGIPQAEALLTALFNTQEVGPLGQFVLHEIEGNQNGV